MIRKMKISDYNALFAMWRNTPDLGLRSLDDSEEGISLFLKRNPDTNFIACEDGRLAGAILSGHDGRRGYIYHTVVLPEYRGRGIASQLVRMVESIAERGDLQSLFECGGNK